MSEATGDSGRPEFPSWRSYWDFQRHVRQSRRYVWDKEVHKFLDTVLQTRNSRDVQIPKGSILWRAQLGIHDASTYDEEGNEIEVRYSGLGPERMKPLVHGAREGRVNSAGITVLYLATKLQTAISEVRPWIGSEVSAAQFKVTRDLRAIDLSRGFGKSSFDYLTIPQLMDEDPVEPDKKEQAVWSAIDNAFSKPITLSEDPSEYVPTQILAELFQAEGYEALVYRSQFGENGYNIAMFNVEDAEILSCAPYEVESIEVKYKQIGNHWSLT